MMLAGICVVNVLIAWCHNLSLAFSSFFIYMITMMHKWLSLFITTILELAWANFLSAFWQQSHSAEALFSAILMLSVKLSWWLLYHSTFLSDTEDASSLYMANNDWPCDSEGFFNLTGWYFYHRCLWCFYNMQSICFAHITSLTMCCGDELGHPMDVPGLGLKSSFEKFCHSL